MMNQANTMRRLTASVALVALLGACAGPIANSAFEEVASATEQRIGKKPVWIKSAEDEAKVRKTIDELLGKPLSADDAVQVALLNNRRLQSNFSELGIGAADLTSSWRPENPGREVRLRPGHRDRTFHWHRRTQPPGVADDGQY